MSAIGQFLSAVDAFCAARGISEARASTIILNGGGRIGAIRSGASDIGARTLDKAMQWLSDNWPEHAVWPADVPRPPKASDAVSTSPPPDSPRPSNLGAAATRLEAVV